MIIIIPLGGIGDRFKKNGYSEPKPLINVIGKTIISWLLDNVDLSNVSKIVIPYNRELEKYRFEEVISFKYNTTKFVFHKLEYDTEGPIETILEGLNILEVNNEKDCPILSLDSDNFYKVNVIEMWKGDNSVFLFEDDSDDVCYSYVTINNDKITNIAEKDKISCFACTGGYGFKSWKTLKSYGEYIVQHNIKQKNEYYVSSVIKEMIQKNEKFTPKFVEKHNFVCLGTPVHVRLFAENAVKNSGSTTAIMKDKRICFDLDNTLVTYPKVIKDYTTVEPIIKNIELVRRLKKLGCYIIIQTARGMKTYKGNVGCINKHIADIVFSTLNKFDIPYDEIHFGKPFADFYIDDAAISAYDDLEKKIGLYGSDIAPREFNSIVDTNIRGVRKRAKYADLSGEIYFYRHIPDEIENLFPLLLKYDREKNRWYEMERIEGVPLAKLYLAEQLTEEIVKMMVEIFNKIHSIQVLSSDVTDIYANYHKKIQKRYETFDYTRFDILDSYYKRLISELTNYADQNKGIKTIIHGDPVMTNILMDNTKKIKMIDMRGKIGDKLSIYGDKMYDWAKFYQSLIGYDEILEGKTINSSYKNNLIRLYESLFVKEFGNRLDDLKLITSSLLFSLLPLHDNDKCQQYYNLGKRLIMSR